MEISFFFANLTSMHSGINTIFFISLKTIGWYRMAALQNLPPDFVATFNRPKSMLKLIGINIFGDENTRFFRKHGRVIFFGSLLIPMLIGLVLFMVWSDKTGASFLEAVSVVPVLLVLLQGKKTY